MAHRYFDSLTHFTATARLIRVKKLYRSCGQAMYLAGAKNITVITNIALCRISGYHEKEKKIFHWKMSWQVVWSPRATDWLHNENLQKLGHNPSLALYVRQQSWVFSYNKKNKAGTTLAAVSVKQDPCAVALTNVRLNPARSRRFSSQVRFSRGQALFYRNWGWYDAVFGKRRSSTRSQTPRQAHVERVRRQHNPPWPAVRFLEAAPLDSRTMAAVNSSLGRILPANRPQCSEQVYSPNHEHDHHQKVRQTHRLPRRNDLPAQLVLDAENLHSRQRPGVCWGRVEHDRVRRDGLGPSRTALWEGATLLLCSFGGTIPRLLDFVSRMYRGIPQSAPWSSERKRNQDRSSGIFPSVRRPTPWVSHSVTGLPFWTRRMRFYRLHPGSHRLGNVLHFQLRQKCAREEHIGQRRDGRFCRHVRRSDVRPLCRKALGRISSYRPPPGRVRWSVRRNQRGAWDSGSPRDFTWGGETHDNIWRTFFLPHRLSSQKKKTGLTAKVPIWNVPQTKFLSLRSVQRENVWPDQTSNIVWSPNILWFGHLV